MTRHRAEQGASGINPDREKTRKSAPVRRGFLSRTKLDADLSALALFGHGDWGFVGRLLAEAMCAIASSCVG